MHSEGLFEQSRETPHDIFQRVFRTLRPRTPLPSIQLRFCDFANANSFIQLKHGAIEVRITDILEKAPAEVMEALAVILLSKLFRRPVPKDYAHRYRRHLAGRDVRAHITLVRQTRGRKELTSPQGSHYDLIDVFETVNRRYFHGLMPRPDLGWSLRVSRQTLGHYDSSHHTIVLSRVLDSMKVPRIAVEFVMYHEMLHIRYPVQQTASARRCVHTAEFKIAERLFDGFAQAKSILKSL
jgi:hypothetical protein